MYDVPRPCTLLSAVPWENTLDLLTSKHNNSRRFICSQITKRVCNRNNKYVANHCMQSGLQESQENTKKTRNSRPINRLTHWAIILIIIIIITIIRRCYYYYYFYMFHCQYYMLKELFHLQIYILINTRICTRKYKYYYYYIIIYNTNRVMSVSAHPINRRNVPLTTITPLRERKSRTALYIYIYIYIYMLKWDYRSLWTGHWH